MRARNREHFLTGEPLRDPSWFTIEGQRAALTGLEQERAAGSRDQFGVMTPTARSPAT